MSDSGNPDRADQARLKLGDFGERGIDHVFDRANLGGEFESGVFNLMLAHMTAPFRATRIARIWLPK
jgi:hypothetical protein